MLGNGIINQFRRVESQSIYVKSLSNFVFVCPLHRLADLPFVGWFLSVVSSVAIAAFNQPKRIRRKPIGLRLFSCETYDKCHFDYNNRFYWTTQFEWKWSNYILKDGLLINFVERSRPHGLTICTQKRKKNQSRMLWQAHKLTCSEERVRGVTHRKKPKSLTTFGESVNYYVSSIFCEIIWFWYCFSALSVVRSLAWFHTILMGIKRFAQYCVFFYSFRFVSVWTVIIVSNWFGRRIICDFFLWFFAWKRCVQHLHAIFICIWSWYVIKVAEKGIFFLVDISFYDKLHFLSICQLLQTTNKQHVQFMTFSLESTHNDSAEARYENHGGCVWHNIVKLCKNSQDTHARARSLNMRTE